MKTITHDLRQGSDEWLSFRFHHDGASEISAVLGLSKNTKRSELLRIKHTGIGKEFSDYVQRYILDKGHEVEALARPIVEKIIGAELYPVTMSKGRMSASCDGLTITDDEGWENKQYNAEYFAMVQAGEVPEEHMPQVQQCLFVTGANRWFFTISDGTEERTAGVWVYPDLEYFQRIKSAWDQFNKDLEGYVFEPEVIPAKADPVMALPSLAINVGGSISIQSNLDKFGERLKGFIAETNAYPETDTDFANLEQACKVLKEAEDALKQAESNALAQTASVDEMRRTVAFLADMARTSRLQFEKTVKSEKENRKAQIVAAAKASFSEHYGKLQVEIPFVLNAYMPSFADAIKGKKTLSSMQDAVNTMLANAKIEADALARDLREKHAWYIENAGEYSFLFSDLQALIYKDADSFQAVARNRITTHLEQEKAKAEAAAKAQAEREERIRREAEEKARREAEQREEQIRKEAADKARREEQQRIAAEQAKKERIEREAKQAAELIERERLELENQEELDHAAQKAKQERVVVVVDTGEQDGGNQTPDIKAVGVLDNKNQNKQALPVDDPAEKSPPRDQIIKAVAARFFVTFDVAEAWLVQEFGKELPVSQEDAA